jgi:hypothetical protein
MNWRFLLDNYGRVSNEAQTMIIHGLTLACHHANRTYESFFPLSLKLLCHFDSLSPDAITDWGEQSYRHDVDGIMALAAAPIIAELEDDD